MNEVVKATHNQTRLKLYKNKKWFIDFILWTSNSDHQ